MKKLRKSKSTESLKSYRGVSPSSETTPTKQAQLDGSPLELDSNTRDARVQMFRSKILPYVPDYVKDIFERLLHKTECKDTQTEQPGMKDNNTQYDLETCENATETDSAESVFQQTQTELITENSQTQTENLTISKETSVDLQMSEVFTNTDLTDSQDISIQTETQILDLLPAERKLEQLTKSLNEHVNVLKECAEISQELTEQNDEIKDGTIFLNDEPEEKSWLPLWSTGNPLRGLASLLPTRSSLFSPMATLITPLGTTCFCLSLKAPHCVSSYN